jgi:hypothetical protein
MLFLLKEIIFLGHLHKQLILHPIVKGLFSKVYKNPHPQGWVNKDEARGSTPFDWLRAGFAHQSPARRQKENRLLTTGFGI